MDTLPRPVAPSISSDTVFNPAGVATSSVVKVPFVARRTAAARQRIPLPDISAVEPSALKSTIVTGDDNVATSRPSAPTPVVR